MTEENKNNVINLFEPRKKEEKDKKKQEEEKDFYFAELMKQNKKKEKKLEKDRQKANKGVKRSYRLDK